MVMEIISITSAQNMKIIGSQLSTTGLNKLPENKQKNTLSKIFVIILINKKIFRYQYLAISYTCSCNIPSLLKTFALLYCFFSLKTIISLQKTYAETYVKSYGIVLWSFYCSFWSLTLSNFVLWTRVSILENSSYCVLQK